MRIINLIENTEGSAGCTAAHGLSFYIETKSHRLLLDLGPSDETLKNAAKLGIDLSKVDTVILSHGHYDHSGGIMPFAAVNRDALIYMQRTAPGDYFRDNGPKSDEGGIAPEDGAAGNDVGGGGSCGGRYKYIGIDKRIADLPQIRFVDGDLRIDNELELFTVKHPMREIPFTNKNLLRGSGDGYIRDDFVHEQALVITDGGKHILMSGCAHNGILNILDTYREKYGSDPDFAISGFHLKQDDEYSSGQIREIGEMAEELKGYGTGFITCHCTGIPAFKIMKSIMGDQLMYAHSGDDITGLVF